MLSKMKKAGLAASLALISSSAVSGILAGGPWDRTSQVTDNVIDNGGSFTYEFTVINTSERCRLDLPGVSCNFFETGDPLIIDWELPYFDDAAITNIQSPAGWTFAIETIGVPNLATGWEGVAAWQDPTDPWYAGPDSPYTSVTQVLHWYVEDTSGCSQFGGGDLGDFVLAAVAVDQPPVECPGILPEFSSGAISAYQPSLSGFTFDSIYDSTAAPYQASWFEYPVQTGDPAFPLAAGIPNSPSLQGTQPVPTPAPLLLLAAASLGLLLKRRS